MFFLINGILVLIYLLGIILACVLFTNAIESLGSKLKLSNSATGGILAVIGTTLPETIVPIIAILSSFLLNKPAGLNIAQGAIIGSPFMLSVFAMSLLGICLIFLKRKTLNIDNNMVFRFYKYFLITYSIGILASFIHKFEFKLIVSLFLVISYVFFVKRTLAKAKDDFIQEETEELFFRKILKAKSETICLILFQILISLVFLVIFSHLFVHKIAFISEILNLNPTILSLIITPFATELPECINSIIWIKAKKDDLAVSNILGATVFQAVIPMSIGIIFTPWILPDFILLNSFVVVFYSLFVVLTLLITKKIRLLSLLSGLIFYFGYIVFILLHSL